MKKKYILTAIILACFLGASFSLDLGKTKYMPTATQAGAYTDIEQLQKQISYLEKRMKFLEDETKRLSLLCFTRAEDGRYIFSANGALIEIGREGNVTIRANIDMKLQSMRSTEIISSGFIKINAVPVVFNNGNRPVAFRGGVVDRSFVIVTGTSSVLVPDR